jgi:hypothetical protein
MFNKSVYEHITRRRGCSKCLKEETRQAYQEKFIKDAKAVHGNKYDYSEVVYVGKNVNVAIRCSLHGVFDMRPGNHLIGQNCPMCSNNGFLTTDRFIYKATQRYGTKFDYSKTNYSRSGVPVIITCRVHGDFTQTPYGHLDTRTKEHCPKCSPKSIRTYDDFVEAAKKVHGDKYDYSDVIYSNMHSRITIGCPIHGDFIQLAQSHLKRSGCRACRKSGYSAIALEWITSIMRNEGIHIQHAENGGEFSIFHEGRKIVVDGYCAETNTIYEFHGDFFHGNPERFSPNDVNPLTKMTYGELYQNTIEREAILIKLGYKVVTIWEKDYKRLVREKTYNPLPIPELDL